MRWIAFASAARLIANTGAPHPSIAVVVTRCPVRRSVTSRICTWSGCSGCRYVSIGQPFVVQARSMAACLPEQFIRTRAGAAPARTIASRAGPSPGHAGGHCKAVSSRPAASRMSRTAATCRSVPEWLAVAMPSRSPSRGVPAASIASACTGLSDERGRIGASVSPSVVDAPPSGDSTIADPTWRDSMNPLRSTTARGTALLAAKVSGTPPA